VVGTAATVPGHGSAVKKKAGGGRGGGGLNMRQETAELAVRNYFDFHKRQK
jgi:hypothetical protein